MWCIHVHHITWCISMWYLTHHNKLSSNKLFFLRVWDCCEWPYFWESCSSVAAFWAAGLCLAWLSQPWALYSTQSVPWLWPSRKRWGFSPCSSRLAPVTQRTIIPPWCQEYDQCCLLFLQPPGTFCWLLWQAVTGWVLTFVFSLCRAVVAEESLQHGFLWTSWLNSLLLHQPKKASSLICPGQGTHLWWKPTVTNVTYFFFHNHFALTLMEENLRSRRQCAEQPNTVHSKSMGTARKSFVF